MEHSLIVKEDEKIIFTSDRHWLHPLFELEDFLLKEQKEGRSLFLHDKIAGKAAAALIVRLGFRKCHIDILSRRAIPVFTEHGIEFTFNELVDQIQCRTEDLITDQMSIDDTWLFLRKRAGRVQGLSLKIENLTVKLGTKQIINNLNLEVPRGEQLIIQGANGSGKTTLLKSILGLIRPEDGNIFVGDILVGSPEWNKERSRTGYMHQENVKGNFPITAREVVEIGLSGKKMPKDEMDYRVEIAMRRTGSYHLLKRSFLELSGGEKQRVSLARCLCQNAQIILFDEPTSFLDIEGKEVLNSLLVELSLNEAPTMIVVSHDIPWIERLGWQTKELKCGELC